jgi:hypothetical protein
MRIEILTEMPIHPTGHRDRSSKTFLRAIVDGIRSGDDVVSENRE